MLTFLRATGLVFVSLLFSVLLLEGVLRCFPVNQGLHTLPVDQDNPILHFEPNRTSTWSRFADFSMVNTVHANNFGFINDQDYTTTSPLPLAAIIGDSYVEAAMVPYPSTLQGRLSRHLGKALRIYSFGASGAPLSQYLAYAEYARNTFHPQKMIFVIVGNDFDESLLTATSSPGFHYFRTSGQGDMELTRLDYAPSWTTKLLRRSSLAMYLATNIQVQLLPKRLAALFSNPGSKDFAGQTSAAAAPTRLRLSQKAVDQFFRRLPNASGLNPSDILFVVDGIRPQLYDPASLKEAGTSYFALMRQDFIMKAAAKGYHVEDMQPVFQSAHEATGTRFEFPEDGHWNAAGHELAAKAVLQSGVLRDLR